MHRNTACNHRQRQDQLVREASDRLRRCPLRTGFIEVVQNELGAWPEDTLSPTSIDAQDAHRTIHRKSNLCYFKQQLEDELIEHKQYIDKYGEDMPEIRNWKWEDAE